MAKVVLPRYLRPKRRADGLTGYFWERPSWARPPAERYGRLCPVDSEALGTDLAAAIGKAELLNTMLDEWRLGAEARPATGTVKWLMGWYRGLDRFKNLGFKSRRDYRAAMETLVSFPLKSTLLGDRRVAEIEAAHVDAIYVALQKRGGKRTAAYAMQVGRRVWNEAIRHKKAKDPNPFARMGIKTGSEKGNRPTTRDEYDLFRETARGMGIQSMAAAAALSFELVRRVTDVFGYVFEGKEDEAPGIFWEDYQPGVSIALRQGKTGDRQVIPLRGESVDGQPGPLLYPALEEELARLPPATGHMVINEETGHRYSEDQAQRVFRKIHKAAGLPKGMTLTGFRHGGATELGDAGIYDIRPVSGHRTLQQTTTYNKANENKARSAGEVRRAHVKRNKSQ